MLSKKKLDQNKYNHIKLRLPTIFTDVTDFKNYKNVPLHPNVSYYQMCISKETKSDIIIINIIRQPNTVSWFETISLIRTCSK